MTFPFSTTDLNQLKYFLSSSQRIVILAHKSPDGDSVGSSLALLHFLKSYTPNAQITVCHPDATPKFLHWTKAPQLILNFDEHQEHVESAIQQADLLINLDFNDFSRLGKEM
jgi:phosphoesterase RecJ-like protein